MGSKAEGGLEAWDPKLRVASRHGIQSLGIPRQLRQVHNSKAWGGWWGWLVGVAVPCVYACIDL